MKNKKLSTLVKVSILASMSLILMFILELPLPIFPDFLKIDFSDIPALVGAFALGPIPAVVIELVKNVLHFFLKPQTMGIGELANFVVGSSLVFTSGLLYKMEKSRKGALKSIAVGVVVMSIVAAITNYFVFLPLYETVMGYKISSAVAAAHAVNPVIKNLNGLIVLSILPFNILKGLIISIITFFLYKGISPILHK